MKPLDFKDRWFVVTGAARGLGRSIAERLVLQEGGRIVAVDIRSDLLEDLQAYLDDRCHGRCVTVMADLSTPEGVDTVFREAISGRTIFGLVNSAGLTHFGQTSSVHLEYYERIVDVNFMALMKLTLMFIEDFRKRDEGCVLNVSSIAGRLPLAYQNVYSASKHAVQGFSESLQGELRHTNVSVSIFAPGGIRTAMLEESGLSDHFSGRSLGIVSPYDAAQTALKCLKKRRRFATAGLFDSLCLAGERLLPPRWSRGLATRIYRPKERAA